MPFNRVSGVKLILGVCLVLVVPLLLPLTAFGASGEFDLAGFVARELCIFLCLMPEILNLLLVLVSVFLMLDGVYRWGTGRQGAFSRALIGLFVLHSISNAVPFVPYLALILEVALCLRNARRAEKLTATLEKNNRTISEFAL